MQESRANQHAFNEAYAIQQLRDAVQEHQARNGPAQDEKASHRLVDRGIEFVQEILHLEITARCGSFWLQLICGS